MSNQQIKVTFEPHGRSVFVLPGTKVMEAASHAGLTLDMPCGGSGTCGKCRAQFTNAAPPPGDRDRRQFDEKQLQAGWRLACHTTVEKDCVIHIPATSLFASQYQIMTESSTDSADEVLPTVRKVYVELLAPSLDENEADLLRLERKTGPFRTDLSLLHSLPAVMRSNNFKGTAVFGDHHLIDFEAGDTTSQMFGAAFDIGTTTLVASLLNLCSGEELAITSRINPQVSFGDDVLSRIQHASSSKGLSQLQEAVITAINEMIAELCKSASIDREKIYEVTFAGNTTMQHLLCGLDVTQLGVVPFVPAHGRGLLLNAADLGVSIHKRGCAYVYPVIGGFVGGDTVAGIVAAKLHESREPSLMIDIGTNGEIVLAHEGKFLAASTAAGPAFEGARISCGMRATRGAIEKVVLDGDVRLGVIGNVEATGICGSGLIDLAAELLRKGIVSPEGRLLPPDELPADLNPVLARRMSVDSGQQCEFLIGGSAGSVKVALTQRDIRELQLATGAIRAGIAILLKQAGLKATDLSRVLIAGGFGSFIRRSNAQRIGLLPNEIHHEKIQYVGNTSLNGARWALLSSRARKLAEDLARQTRHVELSQDMDFQMEFAEAMIFPG